MDYAKAVGRGLKDQLVADEAKAKKWYEANLPKMEAFLRGLILTWEITLEDEDGKTLRTITPHPDCILQIMETAIVTIGPEYGVKEKGDGPYDTDPEAFFKIVLQQAQRLAPQGYLASRAGKPDEAILMLGEFKLQEDFPDLQRSWEDLESTKSNP